MEKPRRTSKLDDDDPFGPPRKRARAGEMPPTEKGNDRPSSPVPADQGKQEGRSPRAVTAAPPVSRNPRRLTVRTNVSDEDMVSFNCKMSRGLRRSVRHYAADVEVDIQDVVAAALVEYLIARDRDVPAFELRQPD